VPRTIGDRRQYLLVQQRSVDHARDPARRERAHVSCDLRPSEALASEGVTLRGS
jgi:hypothetical protein